MDWIRLCLSSLELAQRLAQRAGGTAPKPRHALCVQTRLCAHACATQLLEFLDPRCGLAALFARRAFNIITSAPTQRPRCSGGQAPAAAEAPEGEDHPIEEALGSACFQQASHQGRTGSSLRQLPTQQHLDAGRAGEDGHHTRDEASERAARTAAWAEAQRSEASMGLQQLRDAQQVHFVRSWCQG